MRTTLLLGTVLLAVALGCGSSLSPPTIRCGPLAVAGPLAINPVHVTAGEEGCGPVPSGTPAPPCPTGFGVMAAEPIANLERVDLTLLVVNGSERQAGDYCLAGPSQVTGMVNVLPSSLTVTQALIRFGSVGSDPAQTVGGHLWKAWAAKTTADLPYVIGPDFDFSGSTLPVP